jgi:hypothetical protein
MTRRRRIASACALAGVVSIGVGLAARRAREPAAAAAEAVPAPAAPSPADAGSPSAPRPELPRGGRTIFPDHRLVGFCGTKNAPKLGRLSGNLAARAKTIETFAEAYATDRKPLPVFELIAVVVQDARGRDGMHRRRVPDAVVDRYLAGARAARALLLLNIQPGHSDFATEVKHFEKWLREPDVGVALDPEWAMNGTSKTPGASFGQMRGETITEIARYLAMLVEEGDLPEKVLVFHQVNTRVLTGEQDVTPQPGVVIVKSVDGLGRRPSKIKTYEALVKTLPPGVHAGFKLFFEEDTAGGARLMTPEQVLALAPVPAYVMYE